MNFDAARLAKLSGLGPLTNTGVLTESKEERLEALSEIGGEEELDLELESDLSEQEPDIDAPLFELTEDELVYESEEDVAGEPEEEVVGEASPLTIDSLRETVLELRNEILEEQAAEQQAITEAPVRSAIRKEIQALLSNMPADATTNWMYGNKGRPSTAGTAAATKSRATALFGLGFETK